MKRAVIALLACASFSAMASSVGVNNSNALSGGVNLECSTSDGNIIEVDGKYTFPQMVTFNSDLAELKGVHMVQGWKIYDYATPFNVKHAILVKGSQVVIEDADNNKFMCGK